jgi:hypothetical protein
MGYRETGTPRQPRNPVPTTNHASVREEEITVMSLTIQCNLKVNMPVHTCCCGRWVATDEASYQDVDRCTFCGQYMCGHIECHEVCAVPEGNEGMED